MSMWGTGIKQSDEFMDVYDEFYERYVDDADPMEVYRSILEEYRSEFSEDAVTPILYTVYYALALCLWECGRKDPWLWEEIDRIIASEADLEFWSDLGMDAKMRKSRQKALLKFQEKLNAQQPARIRKAKKTTKPRLPSIHKGEIYGYLCGDGYRAALVLDYLCGWGSFLIAVTDTVFDHMPTVEEVMDATSSVITWYGWRDFVPKKYRTLIATLDITGDYNNRAGLLYSERVAGCSSIGRKEFFYDLTQARGTMIRNGIGCYLMRDLLDPRVLPFYRQPPYLP